MTTTTAALRPQESSAHSWIFAAFGLVAFGIASGVAIALGEMAAFYVALSLVTALAVLFNFRLGAFLLIVIVPFGATQLFPHQLFGITGLNPLNVVLAATLISVAMRRQFAGLPLRPLAWLFVVPIVIAGLIGMRHADDIPAHFYEAAPSFNVIDATSYFRELVIRPMLLVVAALLVGVAAARSPRPERFIYAIAISICLLAMIEMTFIAASGVHFSQLASPAARRFFNELGLHANDLGRLFAVGYAVILFVWWETTKPGLKTFLLATLGLAALGLVFTFSRGGMLAFFVVNGLFLMWKFNAKKLVLALGAGLVAMAFAPHYLWRRLTYGVDTDANAVSAERLDGIWTPLFPEIWKSPVWGNGIDSTLWSEPMQNASMLIVGHPHNAYLQAVLDMGFVGLALLLAFYWHVWKGFRALGSNAYLSPEMRGFFQGATAALICLMVAGVSGGTLRPDVPFAYLWVAIGIMYGLQARRPAN